MTGFMDAIAAHRGDPGQGRTLAEVMSGAGYPERREPGREPRDGDEIGANLMARGYTAGGVSDLSRRLADCESDLAAEHEKIERGERRSEHVSRDLAAGRIGALEASARMDGDFGDASRAVSLERRADSLRRQLADATAVISAPQRAADPLEAAASRARQTFRDTTRAMLAEARQPEPRPFAGGGVALDDEPQRDRGQEIMRSLGPARGCRDCADCGFTESQSRQIHAGVPL